MDQIDFTFRDLEGDLPAIARRSKRGGVRRIVHRSVGGLSCGWSVDPKKSTRAWVELKPDGLIGVDTLTFAQCIATALVGEVGVIGHDAPTINRIDFTTDVGFRDPLEPQRVLIALTALHPANHKLVVVYGRGSARIESVSWAIGKRNDDIRLRVYDKSAESAESAESGVAGSVLRFERQDRRRHVYQRTVEDVQAADLSREVTKPLRLGTGGGLLVADLAGMHAHLIGLRDQGVVSQNVAERLLGSLVWAREGGPKSWPDSRTARLRRRELEDLGIALHPQLVEPYDLGPILTAVIGAWRP